MKGKSIKDKLFWAVYTPADKAVCHLMLLSDRLRGLDFHRKAIERINGGYYYECSHLRMMPILRRICREASNEDSILDVGCG